jgi:D-threo-aldose 1-dehydrogenase
MCAELRRSPLGSTPLEVTPICVGGGPLSSMPQNFGYEVSAERARDTVRAVFDSPINFLDTSNSYGGGSSEERIGSVIAERGGLPGGFVLATKADRDTASGDFSAARVRRSAEESLRRLGLDRFRLYFLHDPEHITFEQAVAPGGAVEGMVALRDEGLAEHIGVASGPIGLLMRFLELGVFEVVLTHNRFTLVDQSAEPLIRLASERGLGVLNAAVYGGGILARGAAAVDRYAYRPASSTVLARVREMEATCASYGVSLRAAALHFSLRDKRIGATVVGTASPGHVAELLELAATAVPDELFAQLAPLAAPKEEWLG